MDESTCLRTLAHGQLGHRMDELALTLRQPREDPLHVRAGLGPRAPPPADHVRAGDDGAEGGKGV